MYAVLPHAFIPTLTVRLHSSVEWSIAKESKIFLLTVDSTTNLRTTCKFSDKFEVPNLFHNRSLFLAMPILYNRLNTINAIGRVNMQDAKDDTNFLAFPSSLGNGKDNSMVALVVFRHCMVPFVKV